MALAKQQIHHFLAQFKVAIFIQRKVLITEAASSTTCSSNSEWQFCMFKCFSGAACCLWFLFFVCLFLRNHIPTYIHYMYIYLLQIYIIKIIICITSKHFTLWSILAHLGPISTTWITLLKATDSRMHLASRWGVWWHGRSSLLRSILWHLGVPLYACHKT